MLTSRIPEIILFSAARASAAIRQAEISIERGSKGRSRVMTGNMRGGWQHQIMGPYEGMVFNLVDYTIYNEFGTVNMSAQPMLRPSVEDERPRFERAMREAYVA